MVYWREELPRRFAKKYTAGVANMILSQTFPISYAPLSPLTVSLKGFADFWRNSGTLVNELVGAVPKLEKNSLDYTEYAVEFSPETTNHIVWGEYGTKRKGGKYHGGKQPARPLFAPAMKEFGSKIADDLQAMCKDLKANF